MTHWRIALFVLLAQLPLQQQPQRTGTASLEGVVVRLGTNEPISGVDLELTDTAPPQLQVPLAAPATGAASSATAPPSAPPAPFTAKSGSDGKFVFRSLPSGAYKLVAARIGGAYVPFEFGQRGILGRGVVFPLGDGEQKRDVRMEMAPVGTITGRVFDENNRPVGHAAVLALSPMYRDGQQIFNILEIVHTDDHGEYRLFSLVPGPYYVAVRPEDPSRRTTPLSLAPPGRRGPSEQAVQPVVTKRILPTGQVLEETYQFVYYGGSTDVKRATPINVAPGATIGAVDIPIAAGKTRSIHVKGHVVDGSVGGPARGASVRLIPRTFSAHMIVPNTVTDGNGDFDLVGVIPGSYRLYFLGAQVQQRPSAPGTPPPPPPPILTAMLPLEVGNDDVQNLSVAINVGSTVSGKISIEGRAENDPDLSRIRVTLEAVPTGVAMVGSQSAQSISSNGGFSVANVWPAVYRLLVAPLPANTYVKSIRLGNLDLLGQNLITPLQSDGQIEIVIGTDVATVQGRAANERGDGVSNVKVALVPETTPLRGRVDLYRNGATDPSGNFRIINVPPGDYRVFAWEDVEDGAWMDPEFLRRDEGRGKSIRVAAGRGDSVSVTVISGKR